MKNKAPENDLKNLNNDKLQNKQLRLLRTELQDMVSLIARAKQGKISLDKQTSYQTDHGVAPS